MKKQSTPQEESRKKLGQQQEKLEEIRDDLEEAAEEMEKKGNPPQTMSTPRNISKGRHYPGMG